MESSNKRHKREEEDWEMSELLEIALWLTIGGLWTFMFEVLRRLTNEIK